MEIPQSGRMEQGCEGLGRPPRSGAVAAMKAGRERLDILPAHEDAPRFKVPQRGKGDWDGPLGCSGFSSSKLKGKELTCCAGRKKRSVNWLWKTSVNATPDTGFMFLKPSAA